MPTTTRRSTSSTASRQIPSPHFFPVQTPPSLASTRSTPLSTSPGLTSTTRSKKSPAPSRRADLLPACMPTPIPRRSLEGSCRHQCHPHRPDWFVRSAHRPAEWLPQHAGNQLPSSLPGLWRCRLGRQNLRGNDQVGSEWKYVPIRRLALFLEGKPLPGHAVGRLRAERRALWSQIRLNIGSFMQGLFLQELFGNYSLAGLFRQVRFGEQSAVERRPGHRQDHRWLRSALSGGVRRHSDRADRPAESVTRITAPQPQQFRRHGITIRTDRHGTVFQSTPSAWTPTRTSNSASSGMGNILRASARFRRSSAPPRSSNFAQEAIPPLAANRLGVPSTKPSRSSAVLRRAWTSTTGPGSCGTSRPDLAPRSRWLTSAKTSTSSSTTRLGSSSSPTRSTAAGSRNIQALPDLDSNANAIAIEHIKLENEGWERDTSVTEPKEPQLANVVA